MNNVNHDLTDCANKAKCTKKELEDAALNFAQYLYQKWQEWRKCEIIKMDKTIYDNEEPTNIN